MSSDMTKEEAKAKIDACLKEIYALVAECEGLANAHDLGFSLDVAYGMGGWYSGENAEWCASSESC